MAAAIIDSIQLQKVASHPLFTAPSGKLAVQ
jgi:hypothetical protein